MLHWKARHLCLDIPKEIVIVNSLTIMASLNLSICPCLVEMLFSEWIHSHRYLVNPQDANSKIMLLSFLHMFSLPKPACHDWTICVYYISQIIQMTLVTFLDLSHRARNFDTNWYWLRLWSCHWVQPLFALFCCFRGSDSFTIRVKKTSLDD